jgi:hypothetical protein
MKVGDLPKVFLAMPHSGQVYPQAYEAFRFNCCTMANIDPELMVNPVTWASRAFGGLTHNFNVLFSQALCARDNGEATHFAMLHSDIEPEGFWLNILWAEMRRTGAVVMSGIVPIKDRTGRTSTAIGVIDDPWHAVRFIHVGEDTPETFTTADVCRPGELLLNNTGCMLIDIRHPFWDSFCFRVVDRIDRKPDGNRLVTFRSEDWEMSRDIHAAGLPYASTWRVPCRHLGGGSYPNYVEGNS